MPWSSCKSEYLRESSGLRAQSSDCATGFRQPRMMRGSSQVKKRRAGKEADNWGEGLSSTCTKHKLTLPLVL